ncbi:MAG: 50S ribosomal protein L11 methyltransferase [Anaerolineae bacterium]
MNVLELAVTADAEGAEAVAAVFNEYAYGGAVVEQTVTPEPGETLDPARPFTVRAFLLQDESVDANRQALEQAIWHLSLLRPLGELTARVLEEADWANAWKKFYTILHVGQHTVIKPSWLDYAPQPGEVVIELDPGMAFGTGLHPTTRLCLAALEIHVRPGDVMLDVGTGSGILSIGGAKYGAAAIDARDIDPIAVETAQKNVELSGVADRVTVSRQSITADEPSVNAQIVAANILAEIIVELAPALAHHLAPHGILVASGILADKRDLVAKALEPAGLVLRETTREEDWLVMVAEKV